MGLSLIEAEHRRSRNQVGAILDQKGGGGEVADGPFDDAVIDPVTDLLGEFLERQAAWMLIEQVGEHRPLGTQSDR